MRKFLAGAVLFFWCVSLAAAQTSQADRDALIKHLQLSQKQLKDAVKGLKGEQWTWKAAPDRWSVQQCVEHLTLTEDFLRDLVTDVLLKSPPDPSKKDAERARENDEFMLKAIPDRTQRAQAPEAALPKGQWPDPRAMLKEFERRRKATKQLVKTTPQDLRAHFRDFPLRKDLDAYGWILLISAHTQRHIAQIQEVKASPGFPKKSGY
jgi:hypothetical protein